MAYDDDDCIDLTEDLAKVLFLFFGILLAQMIIAKIMRQTGAFYSYSKALSDSSFQSQMKNKEFIKNCEDSPVNVPQEKKPNCCTTCCTKSCCKCCEELQDEQYDPEYFVMILGKNIFMGCSDIWYSDDKIRFAKGLYEDYCLHLFNNHILLSAVMNTRGHPYGTNDILWGYFVQNTLVFFFSSLVFFYIELDSTKYIINLLVVAPFSAIINIAYYYLTACPCIAKAEKQGERYARVLVCLGKVFIVPIILMALAMIFLGAMYSYWAFSCFQTGNLYHIVGTTCQSTLAISNTLGFIMPLIQMLNGKITIKITLLCCLSYTLGSWYESKIKFYNLQKDVHYKEYSINFLYLLKVAVTKEIMDRVEGDEIVVLTIEDKGDVEMAAYPVGEPAATTA